MNVNAARLTCDSRVTVNGNLVAWYENVNGDGSLWTRRVISTEGPRADAKVYRNKTMVPYQYASSRHVSHLTSMCELLWGGPLGFL